MEDKIKEKLLKEIEKWTYKIKDNSNKPSRVEDVYDYKRKIFEAKLEQHLETRKELMKKILICEDAIRSCGDNYGSESCDNGDYEKYFDEDLMEKALKKINSHKFTSTEEK